NVRSAYHRRERESATPGSADGFLRQSEAQLGVSVAKDPLDPRALELVNKTNQFNLNGKRYSEAEWKRYILDRDTFVLLVSYQDKYGLLGKIVVITGRQNESAILVENWVMSCRAFSRRIEYACLKMLYRRYGLDELEFAYQKTARNSVVKDFLEAILAG